MCLLTWMPIWSIFILWKLMNHIINNFKHYVWLFNVVNKHCFVSFLTGWVCCPLFGIFAITDNVEKLSHSVKNAPSCVLSGFLYLGIFCKWNEYNVKLIMEVYCFFLLFQYDLAVSLWNQQKQIIFILVIQLSKQTAPKYASESS